MFGSKKFGVCCTVAAVVALFVGMLAGTAAVVAQEPGFTEPVFPAETYVPPSIEETPAVVPEAYIPPSIEDLPTVAPVGYTPPTAPQDPVVQQPPVVATPAPTEVLPAPPVISQAQAYPLLLQRLLQLNMAMTQISADIELYELLAMWNPGDPAIAAILDTLYARAREIQQEQHDVRFILSILIP